MNRKRTTSPHLLTLLLISIVLGGCKKNAPVVAEFTSSVTEALAEDTVHFINASQNALTFRWDFGDGESSTEQDPSHVYADDGLYNVTLVAMGKEDSDTAISAVDVYWPYENTIYEKVGIEGAILFDSWSSIQANFTSDTAHVRRYVASEDAYFHEVYFVDDNVGFLFVNEGTVIQNDDPLLFIYIFFPYEGGTIKRVGFLSTIKRMEDSYGPPEKLDEGTGYTGYWYDSQGIDFYSQNSGYVDEIDIYNFDKKKSASYHQALMSYLTQYRKSRGTRQLPQSMPSQRN